VPAAPLVLASALLAATPLAVDGIAPMALPGAVPGLPIDTVSETVLGPVETFDPVGRAELLARQLPRQWSGTYQSFTAGPPLPVVLKLSSVRAMGAMVDLRGEISIDGVVAPVQGNLNAKSDQLDLIPLGDRIGGGLEPGGQFQGLQGLELSGWNANRLTDQGGQLALQPGSMAPADDGSQQAPASSMPVRGLW
jgi:hypothetical protein